MRIEILSVATQDIDAGKQFYEQQQEGLGIYFLDAHRPHPGKEAKRYQVENIRDWFLTMGIQP